MCRRIDRLDKYLQIKGLSGNFVENECGLSKGLLSKARAGITDLGSSSMRKILNKFHDLNRVWLLTGEGSMLNNVVQQSNINGDNTSTITNGSDRELLNELAEQRKLTAAAQELASKAQAQTDRLIAIIEKMQNNQ